MKDGWKNLENRRHNGTRNRSLGRCTAEIQLLVPLQRVSTCDGVYEVDSYLST